MWDRMTSEVEGPERQNTKHRKETLTKSKISSKESQLDIVVNNSERY